MINISITREGVQVESTQGSKENEGSVILPLKKKKKKTNKKLLIKAKEEIQKRKLKIDPPIKSGRNQTLSPKTTRLHPSPLTKRK